MINLYDDLQKNTYPGRGIIIGRNSDNYMIAYFIMGRSENSRNRIFVEDNGGIRTQAFDESKLTDPSLIIYAPVRVIGGELISARGVAPVRVIGEKTIVTNGDQTDTIYDFISSGKTFADALRTREFEPDAPNFTPRISGIVDSGGYTLSILKSAEGNSDACRRYLFEYANPRAGEGHFIHTYQCDGDPIPSFTGEPKLVAITDDLGTFTANIWDSLNADNKVSLFTRSIDINTGAVETRILNKNM